MDQDRRHILLSRVLQGLEEQYELLSMVDIVLNHTSTDTPWLEEHPSAGYTLTNSPHLNAAFELDEVKPVLPPTSHTHTSSLCIAQVMLRVSEDVAAGEYQADGIGPEMYNERAVLNVLGLITDHVGLTACPL